MTQIPSFASDENKCTNGLIYKRAVPFSFTEPVLLEPSAKSITWFDEVKCLSNVLNTSGVSDKITPQKFLKSSSGS